MKYDMTLVPLTVATSEFFCITFLHFCNTKLASGTRRLPCWFLALSPLVSLADLDWHFPNQAPMQFNLVSCACRFNDDGRASIWSRDRGSNNVPCHTLFKGRVTILICSCLDHYHYLVNATLLFFNLATRRITVVGTADSGYASNLCETCLSSWSTFGVTFSTVRVGEWDCDCIILLRY